MTTQPTTQPTTPDTARAEADADPAATLAALRKTWSAREQRLIEHIATYEAEGVYQVAAYTRGEFRTVSELLDFIGR